MKKILRMALVLALAGSALLYTSCTKDYSPDIKSLQEQIDGINNNTDGLPWVRTQLANLNTELGSLRTAITSGDQALDTKIGNLTTQLNNAIADIDDAIDKKADKSAVETALGNLNTAIQDLKDELEARLDDIDGEEGRLAALEEAIEGLGTASESIEGLFGTYAKFIQSIAYVPASSDGYVTANAFKLVSEAGATAAELTDTLVVATFKVTPPDARTRATLESANLVAVKTKASAAAPETLKIKKIIYRDDAPGYVDVFATLGGVKVDANNGLAIAFAVDQTENTLQESVTSDYAPLKITADQDILFQIFDAKAGTIIDPKGFTEDDPVKVSPSSAEDSVCVFTPDRWSIVADIAGAYLSPAEAQELLGVKDIAKVSPLPKDTVYSAPSPKKYYGYEPLAFESTVFPKDKYTVVDLIVSGNTPTKLGVAVKNSHAGNNNSGWAYGIYMAVPDSVKYVLTPEKPVSIPWDYKYYDNINDTLIAKIWVAGDRNNLVPANETPTWNGFSEVDYTELPAGTVSKHTNDDKAIDVTLKSAAEYGVADSTYVYSVRKFDKSNATEYVGEFNYVVEARPADLTVELGPIDTMVRFNAATKFEVEAILAAWELHKNYYEPYTMEEVIADAVGKGKIDSVKVTVDGKPVDAKVTKKFGWDKAEKKETTNFSLDLNKVGEWKVYFYTHFANVGYTFVVTINAANNAARIAPKATFITVENAENPKDYSVEVTGDVDTNGSKVSKWHYYLVDQPFQDYLKVIEYAEDSEELRVDLQTVTERAKKSATAVEAPATPVDLVRITENKTVANLGAKSTYKWNKYDSLQFKVAARLVPAAAGAPADAIVDSATVRLWTVDPIPVFEAGDGIVVEHIADQEAKANIVAGITIKDYKGVKLNDENGLITTFGPTKKDKNVIIVNYDQQIKIGDYKVVEGVEYAEEIKDNLKLDKTTGVISLDLNQGVITTPIVVEVPITLSYMLDQGLDAKNTIKVRVTFKEKGR